MKKLIAGFLAFALISSGAFAQSVSVPSPTTVGTALPGQVPGTATNDAAGAGKVGEYVSSNVDQSATTGLTSSVAADVTSVSLTAGNWEVCGNVGFNPEASTLPTFIEGWISTTSATAPTAPNAGALYKIVLNIAAGSAGAFPVGCTNISLSSTTTVYLSALSIFTVSTMGSYGFIGALRTR